MGFTPGLAIGDSFLTWPQADPASVLLVDEFIYNGSSLGTGGTSGTVGQLGWLHFATGGTIGVYASGAPYHASLQIKSNTSVNSGDVFILTQNAVDGTFFQGWPITTFAGWEVHFVFKWPPFYAAQFANAQTKVRMYLGFGMPASSSASAGRPTKFLGLRFDTDTTSPSIGDATYHYEFVQNGTSTNTQGTVIDSGIAPDFNWHRFTMRCLAAGTVLCSIDGGTESSLTVGTDSTTMPSLTNHANGTGLANVGGYAGYPCDGTNVVIAGITESGFTKYNGAWPAISGQSNDPAAFITNILTSETTGTISGATVTWSNCFAPWIQLANSSESSPATKVLAVNYFMYIYNPKLATAFAQTADPTKPRYFDPQT